MWTPIVVTIPHSGGEECWMRPSDAKKMIASLEKALAKFYALPPEKRRRPKPLRPKTITLPDPQGLDPRTSTVEACPTKPSKSTSTTSRQARTALVSNARPSKKSPKK